MSIWIVELGRVRTFPRIQVGAHEYSGSLKYEKQVHSQPFLTKTLTSETWSHLRKGNIPPPTMMMSYSGSPLASPVSQTALKFTYRFSFWRLRMSLYKRTRAAPEARTRAARERERNAVIGIILTRNLWMNSIKVGTVRTDKVVMLGCKQPHLIGLIWPSDGHGTDP